MKTQPSSQSSSELPTPSLTEIKKSEAAYTERETQKISFTQIKVLKNSELSKKDGHIQNVDCENTFTYEKERIKALEHTELYASLQSSTIIAEPTLFASNFHPSLPFSMDSGSVPNCDTIGKVQKIVSMIFMLYSIANFIGAFFAILFISISSLPIVKYLLWIVFEFGMTSVFIYVSIKGHNVTSKDFKNSGFHLCRVSVMIMILLGAVIGISFDFGVRKMLECAMEWNKEGNSYEVNVEAMRCIIVATFFFSSLNKLVISTLYLALGVALRVASQRVFEAEARHIIQMQEGSLSAKKLTGV